MATTPLAKILDSAPGTAEIPPVVLDLGKTKKKLIKALKHGEGELMQDVSDALEAVRSNLGPEMDGRTLIPIVIVYERKSPRKRGLLPFSL